MRATARTSLAFAVFLLVSPTSVSPVVAQEFGEVAFQLTIEGPVPPTHAFAIERACREQQCVVGSWAAVCPTHSTVGPCTATTYEIAYQIEVGLTVDYALLRWTELPGIDEPPDERLIPGSFVVRDGRQVISLRYVYPPGSGGIGPSVLPDTAVAG